MYLKLILFCSTQNLKLSLKNCFSVFEITVSENTSLSEKLSAYEQSALSMKCPIYEMSYLGISFPMKCPVYEMSMIS